MPIYNVDLYIVITYCLYSKISVIAIIACCIQPEKPLSIPPHIASLNIELMTTSDNSNWVRSFYSRRYNPPGPHKTHHTLAAQITNGTMKIPAPFRTDDICMQNGRDSGKNGTATARCRVIRPFRREAVSRRLLFGRRMDVFNARARLMGWTEGKGKRKVRCVFFC